MSLMRVGIDLGGTKIEAVAMDAAGEIRARRRIATPAGYDESLAALKGLMAAVESEAGSRAGAVGLGMPGSISPATGLARNANSTWLNGRPFLKDLGEALQRPVRVANDANCFTLSEAVDGAGAGANVVFGVIIGTGCGGGVAVNGRVLSGASGIAGEWGHTPLPWADDADRAEMVDCWCGRPGCMETFVSGSGFERWGSQRLGRPMKAAEIAASDDPVAKAACAALAERLAKGLAVVMDIADPDVIVLGGGLSNLAFLPDAVLAALPRWVFSDHIAVRIVKNAHGDSSGVRGAAWLWRPEELA